MRGPSTLSVRSCSLASEMVGGPMVRKVWLHRCMEVPKRAALAPRWLVTVVHDVLMRRFGQRRGSMRLMGMQDGNLRRFEKEDL
jgi:hypothetical protein